MRSPRTASAAGSSVSAASTDTSTTAMAPTAIERKIVCGTRNMPISASTTVAPENSTARLAVAPATATASSTRAAGAALLAEAGDDEQRVVDPDRQAHHHEHVDDDEVEDERLADAGDDGQRDDDARDRHADRHDRRHDAAEDDDQDEQREREPEDLAAREVLLGGAAEVLVDRVLADDQRAEPVLPVRRDDALDDRLDVVAQLDEQQRAVAVVRHRPGRTSPAPAAADPPRACSCAARSAGRRRACADDETITASSTRKPWSAAHRRERALQDLLGPLGLRTAGEVVVRGQRRAEQSADRRRRGQDGEQPRTRSRATCGAHWLGPAAR